MSVQFDLPFDICARKHGGNPESKQANPPVTKKMTDRLHILLMIKFCDGLTVDEVAQQWDTTPNAVSGRFSELKKLGLIEKIGTRPTRLGKQAGVYRAR